MGFGSPESSQAGGEGRPRCSQQRDLWQCTPQQDVDHASRPTAIAAGSSVGRQEKTSLPVTWQAPEITFLAFSWKLKCRRRGSGRDPSTLRFTGSGVGSCHGSAGGQPGAGVRGGGCSCRDAALGAGWSGRRQKARVGRKQGGKARKGARQVRWEPRSAQGCSSPWEAVQSSGALADANCFSPVHPLCLALLHGFVHTPALPKANVRKQRLFVTLFKPMCK